MGVYDLVGNVWEWTSTCESMKDYDTVGDEKCSESPDVYGGYYTEPRIMKGGAWNSVRRTRSRSWHNGRTRPDNDIGFRVARNL